MNIAIPAPLFSIRQNRKSVRHDKKRPMIGCKTGDVDGINSLIYRAAEGGGIISTALPMPTRGLCQHKGRSTCGENVVRPNRDGNCEL